VNKQKKTAIELEEIVKQRIGAGDFKVTIHRNPEMGWHATIYGRQPAEVHRYWRFRFQGGELGLNESRHLRFLGCRNTPAPTHTLDH
jgi:hypothetical protein